MATMLFILVTLSTVDCVRLQHSMLCSACCFAMVISHHPIDFDL